MTTTAMTTAMAMATARVAAAAAAAMMTVATKKAMRTNTSPASERAALF